MERLPRGFLYAGIVLLAVPVLVLLVFGVTQLAQAGEIPPGVYAGEVELSRLGDEDARAVLTAHEDDLRAMPQPFVLAGRSFVLDPARVDLRIDIDAAIADAKGVRSGSILTLLGRWFSRPTETVPLHVTIDPEAARLILAEWEKEAIDQAPFDGMVAYEDGRLVASYPEPGLGVDQEPAVEIMARTFQTRPQEAVELPVTTIPPRLTRDDVDAALIDAQLLLAGPVTLSSQDPEAAVTFEPTQLGEALRAEIVTNSPPEIEFSFDPALIARFLRPLTDTLEAPPRDAQIVINDDDTVTLIPGRSGTLVDPELVAEAAYAAANRASRSGRLPLAEGTEPEFTTAEARALGIRGLVAEFTTEHPCCQPRVTNIQTMADLVDGTLVLPGEEFSLNAHVGERTIEKGFVPAPMILRGEFVDSVGGGVSQFATTLYNAVFFGGYEDVVHQPHSYYFSRYPEGREATVSWPRPELIFRNDTDAAVLIKTSYTSTSITVKLYGDNGGREVEAGLSDRYSWEDPPVEYEADPNLEPGEEKVTQAGFQGWSVTVYRTITYPDGEVVEQSWPVRYRPQPRKISVHPCMIEGSEVACPTTTTTTTTTMPPSTTAPAPTSTTLPAPTSTTVPPPPAATTTTAAPPPPSSTTTTPSPPPSG